MTRRPDRNAGSDPACDALERVPVLRPLLPDADRLLSYLRRIDAARTYTNWGPLASQLETGLADHFGLPGASVTSACSGTAALVAAILAAAGKATASRPVALMPAFTFVATALAAEQCGFRPHLVDVDADSWLLSTGAVDSRVQLADVGVVIPVAAFGRAVPQAPWQDFHRRTGIAVVIDGGASFEAVSADPARCLGEIPVSLSFHATKSFSTAEGGCVVTTDAPLSVRVGTALNFGFFESRTCVTASTNGKMSEYHAAVGLAELDGWQGKRVALRGVADAYRRRLSAVGLGDRLWAAPDVAGCYALFRCRDQAEAESVVSSLARASIESRFWYGHGLHRQPYYADVSRDDLPVTDRLAPLVIALPVAPDLSPGLVDRVVHAVVGGVG
jgi:dTDP-4-amino-4,6-dideoxygalactose transaminase